MPEINLLDLYPKAKRNLEHRAQVAEANRAIAKQYGMEYFDGTRDQGYGGYRYDGRWIPVIKRMQEYYQLADTARILDVGCGKGFMLHDFKMVMPASTVAGIDISQYAIDNAMEDVKAYLRLGNCVSLPYKDKSFDLVISINTVHNVPYDECVKALHEIERVSSAHKFIVVDAYRNEKERDRIRMWNLTAETILPVKEWEELFKKSGYTGDYYWFIP